MHLSDVLAVYMFLHKLPTGVEALAYLPGIGMFGGSRKVLNNTIMMKITHKVTFAKISCEIHFIITLPCFTLRYSHEIS